MSLDGICEVGDMASEGQAAGMYWAGSLTRIGQRGRGDQELRLVLKRSWQRFGGWWKVIMGAWWSRLQIEGLDRRK